jgi:hypothetical protein
MTPAVSKHGSYAGSAEARTLLFSTSKHSLGSFIANREKPFFHPFVTGNGFAKSRSFRQIRFMASPRRFTFFRSWVPIALLVVAACIVLLPRTTEDHSKIQDPGTDNPAPRPKPPHAMISARDDTPDTQSTVATPTQKPHEPWILRSEALMLAPSIQELALAFERDGLRNVEYRLFQDFTVTLELTNHQIINPDSSVLVGRVNGDPMSQVILSRHGSAQAGSILSPTHGYHLQISNDSRQGWVQVTEIDQESLSRQLMPPKKPPETRKPVHSLQTVEKTPDTRIHE